MNALNPADEDWRARDSMLLRTLSDGDLLPSVVAQPCTATPTSGPCVPWQGATHML